MGLEILTKQFLASTAVEALAAKLGIVCADSFADLEAFDLRAHGGYHANSLMACCEDTVRLGSKRAVELMGESSTKQSTRGSGRTVPGIRGNYTQCKSQSPSSMPSNTRNQCLEHRKVLLVWRQQDE